MDEVQEWRSGAWHATVVSGCAGRAGDAVLRRPMMGARSAMATVAMVLMAAGPAMGAVYCRKAKGAKPSKPIVLREAACKPTETDVTAAMVESLRGPKGDRGDTGPRGPVAAAGLINLSAAGALTESPAAFSVGGGPNVSGIYMPNSSFNRFHVGFTLPPDYVPGADLTLRLVWANGNAGATGCAFVLWANSVVAYRPGTTDFAVIGRRRFSNEEEMIALDAGPTAQAVRAETMTISGGGEGGLRPGDVLQIAIARRADDSADTCTGPLVILGLDATYQPAS